MPGYTKYVLTHTSSVQWFLLGGLLLALIGIRWGYRHVWCDKCKPCTCARIMADCGMLVFLALLLWSTLLLRTPGTDHQANLIPLWSWYQGFLQGNDEIRWQIYFNILLFVPFGCLLYLSKQRSMSKILLLGFLLSLIIELCQLVFKLGLFEWDDLIHNSLGCLLGGFTAQKIERVWDLHRLHKTYGRKL